MTSTISSQCLTGLVLSLALSSTCYAQSKPKTQTKPPATKPTITKPPKGTTDSALPELKTVEWPFPKPGDPGVVFGYAPRKTGLLHDDKLYIEPVLMKEDKTIIFQFGCGLMVGDTFHKDIAVEQVPIKIELKEGKVLVTTSEEVAKAVRVSVADHHGTDPFFNLKQAPILDVRKIPKVYGIAITWNPQPIPLAFDLPSFASLILGSDNKEVLEYGIAYLTCCMFPDNTAAISPDELATVMTENPIETDVNDPSVMQKSAIRRGSALVSLLNRSMQRWAKKGQHLFDLNAPKDDLVPGTPLTRVFSKLALPIHEFKLAKDYADNAAKLSGPDRLTLRMVSNRILLDRILVSGWAADIGFDENGMQRFKNNQLNQWSTRFVNDYGLGAGLVEMMRRMNILGGVSVLQTPIAKQKIERMELPLDP